MNKKLLTFLLIAVGLVGAVVWQVGGVGGSSSYEARFARAMKLMEGLQSRAIPVAFTEDEIDLLEGVYQDSLVRLPNVTNFRNTDKGKLIDQLKAHGLSGTGTNGLSVSGEKVVATALARTDSFKTEIDVVINNIDVPVNNDTKVLIKKLSQSINTLTNDVRLTMLYISWYEALRGTLCTTDDVDNDIYTSGEVRFRYVSGEVLPDMCTPDKTLQQHRCVLGQYKRNDPNYVTTTTCANGCSNGACIRESQSGFELTGPDSVGVGESITLNVKAVKNDGQTDTGYTGTFFVIVAGDDDAIFPVGALTMSGTGMKRINGIQFSKEGIMTITVRSADGYEASKTVVVGNANSNTIHLQSSYTAQTAAQKLADLNILNGSAIDSGSNPLNGNINRQEAYGTTLLLMGLMPSTSSSDYICKNTYNDTPEKWVCRNAEIAYENNIFRGYTHENGTREFKGGNLFTIFEILSLSMKSQCTSTSDGYIDQVRGKALEMGITNATSLNMNNVATRGDFYMAIATFMDYFASNKQDDPNYFDGTIPGCQNRISSTPTAPVISCTGTRPLNSIILVNVGSTSRSWTHDSSPTGPYQNCSFKCPSGTTYSNNSCI